MSNSLVKWLSLKKLQFETYTAVGMLEPTEKGTVYVILSLLLLMTLYTMMLYLPTHISHLVNFFF